MNVSVQSMVDTDEKKPFVMLSVDDKMFNISVESAKTLGVQLIEAAESAIGDYEMFEWLMKGQAKMDETQAIAMLRNFGQHRGWKELKQKKDGKVIRG